MDIYSYLNSKSVADYCRNLGYKFNAYESAFIINDCRRISLEEKHRLIEEVMRTMPDEHPGQLKRNDLSDSFFENAAALIKTDHEMLKKLREGQGLVFSYKYRSDRFDDSIESRQLYSTFDKALEAVRAENEDRKGREKLRFEIVARQPDSEYKITADLTDDYEVCQLEYPYDTILSDLYELVWVYIPVPFKDGDLLCHCTWDYNYQGPMVLNSLCYEGKDESWIEKYRTRCDASDMTAYGYWLGEDGYLYDECVHDYHNLEYFTGELCTCNCHIYNSYKDYRLLKAVSASMKGEIPTHMLLVASDAIRRERDYRQSFPGWDYTEEAYKNAGIEDILTKRRLWERYDKERYNKDNE